MRIRLGLAAALLSAAVAPAFAQSTAAWKGVDVFGTGRFTGDEVEAAFPDQFRALRRRKEEAARLSSRPKPAAAVQAAAEKLVKEIEAGITRRWKLVWARARWVDDFAAEEKHSYLLVDAMELADLARRAPFTAAPAAGLDDPGGLLAAWTRYNDLGWSLARAGTIPTERAECPAFYCLWGSRTPELAAFVSRFAAEAPRRKAEFLRVLKEEKDPARRAAAVFVLAYIPGGAELSSILEGAVRDPDPAVRSAAFEVFSDIAVYHRDVHLPVEVLTRALEYPTPLDRSKALALITAMGGQARYRDYFVQHAGPLLLALLKLKHPASHGLAHSALGAITKESYGKRDYDAWKSWFDRNRGGGPSPAPTTPR